MSDSIGENQEPKFTPEVEVASENFTRSLPVFKSLVTNAPSKKSLIRVINAVAEFPLGSSYPRLLNDYEKQLFALFQEIATNKSTVLTGFLHAEFMKTSEQGENDGRNEESTVAQDRDNSEE